MKLTFRWYGEGRDAVTLQNIRQIPGCTGLMGLLDDKAAGLEKSALWKRPEYLSGR